MRHSAILLLLAGLAGCASSRRPEAENEGLGEAKRTVMEAIGNLRELAGRWQYFHFAFFSQESIDLYRDNNGDAKIDPETEPIKLRFHLHLRKHNLYLTAPAWIACDSKGTPAWSSPGPAPSIEIRDVETEERVVLRMKADILEIGHWEYYPPEE